MQLPILDIKDDKKYYNSIFRIRILLKKTNIIFFLLFSNYIIAQSLDDRKNSFFNLKIGRGLSYVGNGINIEYGKKMYSGYLALGYAESQYAFGKKIPSSYNIAIGSRRYFNKIGKYFRPKIGAHLGWVDQYYNTGIGNQSYDPIIYGIGTTFGGEIYIKYIILDLESAINPIIIFNKKNHPFYNGPYFEWLFPSLGIGVNLLVFKKKKEKTKKEKVTPQFQ